MNILITGGTGLIGQHLTKTLQAKGHTISYLSREKEQIPHVKVYQWDLKSDYIQEEALKNIDYIVHLAGAGIADKRWTDERKQEIIDSRIKPIELLKKELKKNNIKLKGFISSSAIGYYGGNTGEERVNENAKPGNDFLAKCTKLWEEHAQNMTQADRVVMIRTGVVLSEKGGALPKLLQPVKLGVGSPLGSGKQWMSWIHIDDLCDIYIKAIEDEAMKGPYNAVAPTPVRNEEMTKTVAEVLHKPLWAPNVPAFVLKLLFGELAITILGGNYVENKRIVEETKYTYKFPDLVSALQNLLK